MAEQEPGFEVPEAAKQLTKTEAEQLFPQAESPEEPIYIGLREAYVKQAGALAVKNHPRRQTGQKRPQTRRK